MGLKHQPAHDPSLAKEHAAGERVRVLLLAEHARLGTIAYEYRRLWQLHYMMAKSGYIGLCQNHERVLQLQIQPSNSRLLAADDRPDLSLMVYVTGTQMVLNTILTMQHFCQEIEAGVGHELEETGTGPRIKEAFGLAGLTANWSDPGYSAFREILERRDAVEHPKRDNTFNSHVRDWDRVPLSWFLTERAPNAFTSWNTWFDKAASEWNEHPANKPKMITVEVERGTKSTRQAKKPPSS